MSFRSQRTSVAIVWIGWASVGCSASRVATLEDAGFDSSPAEGGTGDGGRGDDGAADAFAAHDMGTMPSADGSAADATLPDAAPTTANDASISRFHGGLCAQPRFRRSQSLRRRDPCRWHRGGCMRPDRGRSRGVLGRQQPGRARERNERVERRSGPRRGRVGRHSRNLRVVRRQSMRRRPVLGDQWWRSARARCDQPDNQRGAASRDRPLVQQPAVPLSPLGRSRHLLE